MKIALIALCTIGLLACASESDEFATSTTEPSSDAEVAVADAGAVSMATEDKVFLMPVEGGNTFACNTCHALKEPAEDGFRRVGHALGDATHRASWKNGQVSEMLDAVNSCLTEWMNVQEPWTAETQSWLTLYDWLDSMAPDGEADPVEISIVEPPADMTGGDPDVGLEIFNQTCIMCHGKGGGGTLLAPGIAGRDLEVDYIGTRVRTSGEVDSPVYEGLTGGGMPFWGADRLSDDELRDIAAFVSGSEFAPPMFEPEPEETAPEDPPDESPEPVESPEPTEPEASGCGSTHSKVGWVGTFETLFHGVAGEATIVDDCTITVDNFLFDGNGIVIEIYAGLGGNYGSGFSVSDNLYNFPEGYHGETMTLTLPEGKTLDDLDGISVWCVTVGVNFGDAIFGAP